MTADVMQLESHLSNLGTELRANVQEITATQGCAITLCHKESGTTHQLILRRGNPSHSVWAEYDDGK